VGPDSTSLQETLETKIRIFHLCPNSDQSLHFKQEVAVIQIQQFLKRPLDEISDVGKQGNTS